MGNNYNIVITKEIYIFRCLLFTAIVTPYRISFTDTEPLGWSIVDYLIIAVFGFDILVNFLQSYYDDDDNLILNRKQISLRYLKTWFMIDLIATIPFSKILEYGNENSAVSQFARIKIYRLIKMTK